MKTLHTYIKLIGNRIIMLCSMRGVLVDENTAQIKLIGNRIIMLCWMRGVLVDENSVHKSS
jgi:hypothetical protein